MSCCTKYNEAFIFLVSKHVKYGIPPGFINRNANSFRGRKQRLLPGWFIVTKWWHTQLDQWTSNN